MRRKRGRVIEVESLAELDGRLATGATDLSGWRLRDLDLTGYDDRLAEVRVAGSLFLGCQLSTRLTDDLRTRGAMVFSGVPDAPVDGYRSELYSPGVLYDDAAYAESLDARVYAWSRQQATRETRMAQALHDHAIDEALADWVRDRHLVGVMGGHAAHRGAAAYRDAVLLGHGLAEMLTVVTGGGPGAMEAANLGAWLRDPATIGPALEVLARVPQFRPDIGAWVAAAFDVRDRWPDGRDSLGIPTWHYGHEPSNVFAAAIAKYFRNATREATLLTLCDGGIVFLEGAAGTVQEIFEDACENYYADESSVAPMVLVGTAYWTTEVPAWPLLRTLARGRPMEQHIHLVDTVEEAVTLISTGVAGSTRTT
jgi:predicted Rossmann-fold nucleotide-binding protein